MEKGLKNLQSAGRNALRREKMSLSSVMSNDSPADDDKTTENSVTTTVMEDSGIAEADMEDDDGDGEGDPGSCDGGDDEEGELRRKNA